MIKPLVEQITANTMTLRRASVWLWRSRFTKTRGEKDKNPLPDRETLATTKTPQFSGTHTQGWQEILNRIQLFRLPFPVNAKASRKQSSQLLAVGDDLEPFRCGNHGQFTGSAIVDEEIPAHQKGYVRFRAGWWLAQCDREVMLHPEEIVEIIGIRGITLIVRPHSSSTFHSPNR